MKDRAILAREPCHFQHGSLLARTPQAGFSMLAQRGETIMSAILLAAVLCAEPKPISGSEYYKEACEALDRCKTDKELAKATLRINKAWATKRIVVEFQIEKVINNIAYMHSLEKEGDWRTYVFQSWLPQRGQPGDTITISGVPVIGETKPENEIGTLHGGGKSIKYRVDRSKLEFKQADR